MTTDVVTNVIASDPVERNGTIMVGAPRGAGTGGLGTNYRIRAGGEVATATVTFAGACTADETIVIIDARGVSKTYTAKNSSTVASLQFIKTDAAAAATALAACIIHANGHNGSIRVNDDLAGVLYLAQRDPGANGDTTITEGLTNVTKTDFSGGTHEAGINDADDKNTSESRYTARFDDIRYYTNDS